MKNKISIGGKGQKNNLLTKSELAAATKLSKRTVERWTSQKRIPHYRLSSQIVRYDFEDVLEAWEKFKVKPLSRKIK